MVVKAVVVLGGGVGMGAVFVVVTVIDVYDVVQDAELVVGDAVVGDVVVVIIAVVVGVVVVAAAVVAVVGAG